MKITHIILTLAVVLGLASCGTTKNSSAFSAGPRLLELRMSDLTLLGETEISCEYDTYLGFIRHINKINGETYNPGTRKMLNIPGSGLLFKTKGMRLASAKLMEQYPEACYFQVVMDTKDTDVLFLGSSTVRTAKVRAYKLK